MRITSCLDETRSFSVIAGAGSGKTTSLVTALEHLRNTYGVGLNCRGSQRSVGEYFGHRGKGLYAVRFAPDLLATPWQQYYCFTTLRQRASPPWFSWRHTQQTALAKSPRLMQVFYKRDGEAGMDDEADR